MKKLFVLPFVLLSFATSAQPTFANSIPSVKPEQEIIYNLDSSEKIEQVSILDDTGEVITLTIEKVSANNRSRVASGTYKVTKSSTGNWSVSYNVTINTKNQITSASNLKLTVLRGSLLSSSLKNTTSTATCAFKQKIGILTVNGNVTASISNGKLVVK